MPGKGSGGGTSFEDMSHEQMLAWLDQADAGTVQAAADRLAAAAQEIRNIAEELKVRPQWVDWKGEGAHAFRTWSADLANSTLRLGDFSEGAGKWLREASGAIAQAQASIPREAEGAQANLDAANAAHNAPDAAAVSAKAKSELAALAAHKERVRLEAAAQMRKLGQTYEWSATQMNGLERPKFPPPPKAIVPPSGSLTFGRDSSVVGPARSGVGHAPAVTGVPSHAVAQGPVTHSSSGSVSQPTTSPDHVGLSQHPPAGKAEPPSRMGIDSVGTLPHAPHTAASTPTSTPSSLPGAGRADGPGPAQPAIIPPAFGSTTRTPEWQAEPVRPVTGSVTPGRDVTGPLQRGGMPAQRVGMPAGPAEPGRRTIPGRPPLVQGEEVPTPNSGRMASGGGNGIVGGRPTTPSTGRPTGAIPRGTVVGTEGPTARGPVGRPTTGAGRPVPQPVGRATGVPDGRTTSPYGRVVGDSTQESSRGSLSSGAPVRGGISGGAPTSKRPGDTRANATPRETPSASPNQPRSTAVTPGGRQSKEQRNRKDDRRSARPTSE
ncbi:hypothetical protein AV521_44820 [Streptomyces sp. IMTB 2501]|nr:hypothetical protein AV521_44820 [Streptomyces sp. IMTB 2501]